MKSISLATLLALASLACAQDLGAGPPVGESGRPPEACHEKGMPCEVDADCCNTQCSKHTKVCEAAQDLLGTPQAPSELMGPTKGW